MTDANAGAAAGGANAGAGGQEKLGGAQGGDQGAGQQQGGANGAAAGGAQAGQDQGKGGQQQNGAGQNQGSIVGSGNQGGQQDGGAGQQGAGDKQQQGVWPENWRDHLVEQIKPGDTKLRDRMGRFSSPAAVVQSWLAMEQKLSTGELKSTTAFPKDGTADQQAAWRRDNGVPDNAEGYKIELGNGMVLGEADKSLVADFAKRMHGKNWTNAQVNDAVQSYFEMQDAQNQELIKSDRTYRQQTEDALRAEWGADYRRNINILENFLGALPDGLGEVLAGGRLADGKMIGGDPRVMKWLLGLELERNPNATLVPNAGSNATSVDGRLAEIRKFRSENPDKYDADKAMQKEYVDLIDAQLKAKQRGRAA